MADSGRRFEQIDYAVRDGVATVTLDRPDRRNAFTPVMCAELVEACDLVDADDAVRVLVVTGRGGSFCAGADLGGGAGTFDYRERDAPHGRVGGLPRDRGGVVSLRFAQLTVPAIGAVNGVAVGVGASMILPLDVRLAAESARFGFVFARRGIVPEAASSWFLPRLVGISRAMEWAVTGRVFDAAEALAGGLVSRVLPDGELLDAAYALAREIAENTSAVSVATTRRLMWSMLSAADPWTAHALDTRAIETLGRDADAAEGVRAFLEKRPADFPLRRTADHTDLVPPWPAGAPDPES